MDVFPQHLLALGVATAVLVAIPGPNVALIIANSLRHGMWSGLVTVFGTTLGVSIQLALVVLGMAAVVEFAADVLVWVKWAGVAYLVWLGIRTWRETASDLEQVEAAPALFWRGCLVAAANPKTLLFNAAFLPQFVPASASTSSVLAVAGVFLLVLMLGDMLWAAFASSARPLLGKFATLRKRLTGGFLVLAGIGLALARR